MAESSLHSIVRNSKELKRDNNVSLDHLEEVLDINKFFDIEHNGTISYHLDPSNLSGYPTLNKKCDVAMRHHMLRNDIQRNNLQATNGGSAYPNGNSDINPPLIEYSYAKNQSYKTNFADKIHVDEKIGFLQTNERDISSGQITHKYLDYESKGTEEAAPQGGGLHSEVEPVMFTAKVEDRNSLLYKTKRLFNANKINTIISKYHTDPNVKYNGQVGSQYGESHGRNLLTKESETGQNNVMYNGYDNPYCRVWTHHRTYDRLSKTLRSNPIENDVSKSINYWGKDFEWDNQSVTTYNESQNGENYDYAWRGKHNQERRMLYSVLNETTGLVNITPKHIGNGGSDNIHTKSCMFSIENLAWKDYDPYSFEQSLSWEQRGPLGGRIMWFPPYNLKVTETNNANWSRNDFIGRGEPIYTYVNSERSGTLTFTMLTDHPSSIDYASWHDEGNHTDNDYHRYFAGCFGGANIPNNGGDNLLEKPPHLTDEYVKEIPNLINPTLNMPSNTQQTSQPEDNSTTVTFSVYFPNNYSGVYDEYGKSEQENPQVNAIMYLLFGQGSQKQPDGIHDLELTEDELSNCGGGYEIGDNQGIGKNSDNYIQGLDQKKSKWYYRIDCYVDGDSYGTTDVNTKNTITQSLIKDYNYIDSVSYSLNSSIDGEINDPDLYTFTDVACAMYSDQILNNPIVYKKFEGKSDAEKVKKLIDIFTNQTLTSVVGIGISTAQGENKNKNVNNNRNKSLATERVNTIWNWLSSYEQFNITDVTITTQPGQDLDPSDKGSVNSLGAKKNRCATFTLTFTSIKTETDTSTNDTSNIPNTNKEYHGFKYIKSESHGDETWDYYLKLPGLNYFEENNSINENSQYADNIDSDRGTEIEVKYEQLKAVIDGTKRDATAEDVNIICSKFNKNFNVQPIIESCIGDIGLFNDTYYELRDDIRKSACCTTWNEIYWTKITPDNIGTIELSGDYSYGGSYAIEPSIEETLTNQIIYIESEQKFIAFDSDLNRIDDFTEDIFCNLKENTSNTYEFENILDYEAGDICKYGESYYIRNDNPFNYELDTTIWEKLVTPSLFYAPSIEKLQTICCIANNDEFNEVFIDNNNERYYVIDNAGDWNRVSLQYGNNDTEKSYNKIFKDDTIINTNTDIINILGQYSDISYFTPKERNYNTLLDNYEGLRKCICLYNILDNIDYVIDFQNVRKTTCKSSEQAQALYEQKTQRDSTSYDKDCNNIWIDRGDGLLIKECELTKEKNYNDSSKNSRSDQFNKLRYDQEYHFYKQYMEDHPFVFNELKQKIKYFNPVFHSMTPEGFNSRLTFLNQCTRQGATLTKSDKLSGSTANNLAFGRPPYCVLRLGDFYNQLIIIESINYNYEVSNGLQWDLNIEGNGVQPMLCEVSINFKFIGGGDITGPVRRLQNAMSFNYYANTSFYDNRADRVEYQSTNYATMGGEGNNKVDEDRSYSYSPKFVDKQKVNITNM